MNKYEFTAQLVHKCGLRYGSVIDVGCRDGILRQHLAANTYVGIDVDPGSACDALVDISKPTPFTDGQFDLLVALDVAEHTDNIYASVSEMLRISCGAVIALPNLYNFGMRWRFLRGRPINDKHSLSRRTSESGGYRHRWLFTPREAENFMAEVARESGRTLAVDYYYPPDFLTRTVRLVGGPTLSAETLFFVFSK